jgi:hypothetical protein
MIRLHFYFNMRVYIKREYMRGIDVYFAVGNFEKSFRYNYDRE